jgi:hypothetical protein
VIQTTDGPTTTEIQTTDDPTITVIKTTDAPTTTGIQQGLLIKIISNLIRIILEQTTSTTIMTTSKTSVTNLSKDFINRNILFKYFLFQHVLPQQ